MITSTWLLAPWAMLWVVLIRTLLVRADILPRICYRCRRPIDRAPPGQKVCRCTEPSASLRSQWASWMARLRS